MQGTCQEVVMWALGGCGGYLLLVLHPLQEIIVKNVAGHDMQCQRTISIRNLQAGTCRRDRYRSRQLTTYLMGTSKARTNVHMNEQTHEGVSNGAGKGVVIEMMK